MEKSDTYRYDIVDNYSIYRLFPFLINNDRNLRSSGGGGYGGGGYGGGGSSYGGGGYSGGY